MTTSRFNRAPAKRSAPKGGANEKATAQTVAIPDSTARTSTLILKHPPESNKSISEFTVPGGNPLWSRSETLARELNGGVLRLHGFGINKLDGRSTRRRIERAARKLKRKNGGAA